MLLDALGINTPGFEHEKQLMPTVTARRLGRRSGRWFCFGFLGGMFDKRIHLKRLREKSPKVCSPVGPMTPIGAPN